MTLLVCIAGLPEEVVREIEANPGRFTGNKSNTPITFPIKGHLNFRTGMSDAYLATLAKRVSGLSETADVSIILAYAIYPGKNTAEFLKAFFPFAVTMPFDPIYPNAFAKSERRRNINVFLQALEERLDRLRDCAAQVKDKLSGQNFSPLTLPVRNFRSSVLEPELQDIFENLWKSQNPAHSIANAANKIAMSHPKKTIKGEINHATDPNKPYYLDDRKLRFKSPGGDRHGFKRGVGDGHNEACLLSSRVRLGGPIVTKLHYDCDYFPHRDVTDSFPNCHDEMVQSGKKSHANIAPSDAIW